MEAILLAGGLGTRLYSVTRDNYPKCLAKVNDVPFLHYILWNFRNQGVKRFVLAVSHLSDMVEQEVRHHFADWDIDFSIEREPLGTGGAIRQALALCRSEHVIVANADSFIEFSLLKFVHEMRENESELGLVCTEVDDLSRFGAANIEQGKLIGFSEKGKSGKGFINAGIYWLNTSNDAFLGQPERFSFEKNVLANRELHINVFKTKGLFFDIGTPGDFAGAQRLVDLNKGLFSTSPKIVEE